MNNKQNTQERPFMHGAPQLAENQEWYILGQLCGKGVRQCAVGMAYFQTMQFIGRSADYYHFIGDGKTVLVCSIKFKS